MKSICLKKKNFIGFIFLLVCTLILGCTLTFSNFKQVQADASIVVSGWDNDSDGDGIYSTNITGGLFSSTTSTLEVTIVGNGIFTYSYTKTEGSLSVVCNNVEQTLGSAINLTQESNTIIFTCTASAFYGKGTATVGNFVVTTPSYNVSVTINDSSLGSIEFTNGSYVVGTTLTITAAPIEGAIFLGYVDGNKSLISTNPKYTFSVTGDTNLKALFAKIDGDGTENSPYNFENVITTINENCADSTAISYNRPIDGVCNSIYVAENSAYSVAQDGTAGTATNSLYSFSIEASKSSTIAISSGTKTFNFIVSNPGAGLAGSSISLGSGTTADPYLIYNEDNLQEINKAKSSVFRIIQSFEITKPFTPIGASDDKFTGTLYGDGENTIITGFQTTGGSYNGLFAYTSGGTIKDFYMENIQMTTGGTSAFLIGDATNSTSVSNVHLSGTLYANGSNIGGIVGRADEKGVVATNCTVSGEIKAFSGTVVGGLSGTGGTFTGCIVHASVYGLIVGGLTGGYSSSKNSTNSNFTNCYVAGEVCLFGNHKNNYPYWGLMNGYGAWEKYGQTNSGQKLSVNYTSSIDVEEIKIFNVKSTPNGVTVLPVSDGNGGYKFTQNIVLSGTYALAEVEDDLLGSLGGLVQGSIELSETQVTGVTGNYGGFTIRFKMANGTYKYLSTLNRAEAKFQSNFNLDLDELTSYIDNFSNIEIDATIGTKTHGEESSSSVGGAAKIDNANDFEHLSWIINGGIPTKFKNVVAYNQRSVATISVSLQSDIDLTAKRYLLSDGTITMTENEGAFVLNTSEGKTTGDVLHQFYGFGQSEMMPYRGSIYGNNYTLKVNMNFPNAYMMGIISCATDQSNQITVSNLRVEGTITGWKRVGIVGMYDNYERDSSLKFENVTNNANIAAQTHVGGFLGESQGASEKIANVYLTSCVNNGGITATGLITSTISGGTTISAGDAGGFIGSQTALSAYADATLTNCTNAGRVTATGIAAGFIATANTVTVEGINISKGIIQGTKTSHFYIGNTYTRAGSGTLKTLYKLIILNKPQTEFTINDTTYKTDDNSSLYVEFIDCETFSGKTISISNTYLNSALVITPDPTTMETTIGNLPTSIVLAENTYETTEDSWTIYAIVTFNDESTQTITLTPNLTEAQLNSNQLVFVNAGFTHSTYKIPSTMVATLKRITDDVKNYITSANALLIKTSGTNAEFLALGSDAKTKYDTLKTEIYSYDESNVERFKNYISNTIENNQKIDASESVLAPYFENIVKTADLSALQNLSVNYGTTTITKTLTFTMLATDSSGNNITKTQNITYNISLNGTLLTTATTEGVSFSVGEVTTYKFNDSITVTINKIDVEIEFANKEYVYDSTPKTITATLTGINGDVLGCTLAYNGGSQAINVGEYSVTIASISGDNVIYYHIPESYEKGSLKITPIIYTLSVEANKQFTYNKQPQATEFNLIKQSECTYELKSTDYGVTYNNSTDKPTNAGTYTAVVTLGDNFKISGSNEFTFVINKVEITDITVKETYTYSKSQPSFEFSNFEGIITGDEINVKSFTIYDSKGAVSDGINVGSYTVQVNELSNTNYYINTIIKNFEVIPAKVTITLNPLSSVYGDALILDKLAYTTTDTIFAGDNLNVVAKNIAGTTVGTYPLSATYSNANYDVTIIDSEYEITQREIGINYGTTVYTYNGYNQYSSIKPTLTNVLDADKVNFVFELTNGSAVTTEFKNEGTYTLALKENAVTANYKLDENSKNAENYTINAYNLTLKVKNIAKIYNQSILASEFGYEEITLAGNDSIDHIVGIEYEVYSGENKVDATSTLNIGTYDIKLKLTEKELYSNYNIIVENGILTISARETYIDGTDFEKYYDGEKVNFTAKLYGEDNQEITDGIITYTYYQNEVEVDEVVNVGTYTVKVNATAGENNLPAAEKEFNIVIKTNIVTITLSSTEKEYDAKAFEVGYTYSMSDNHDISNILSYTIQNENKEEISSIKDAGKYYVNFAISNNNYTLSQEEFEVNITPINVNLTISAREETFGDSFDIQTTLYTTDVEPLTNESFELEFAVENYTGIVGTYTITAESKNSNYNITITNGTLTISQRELVVEFTGESSLTYNPEGYANLLTATVTNSLTENSYEVYYLNSNNQQTTSVVDSGTYYLKVTILDNHNYKFKDTTEIEIVKEITISKQELSLTIDLTSKTYDGKAIELNGVYANDVLVGDIYNVEYYNQETLISAPTNVGNYSIKIVEKDLDNYTFTNNTKTFDINQREITNVSIQETFTYNKQARTITFTNFEGLVQGDLLEVTSYTIYDSKGAVSDGINVGSYTVQVNSLSNTNYYVDTIIKSFEVTPAKVTITLNPLSSVYGDALMLDQLSYTTIDTIFAGDNLNVVAENIAGTSVGTYPLSATYSNANYDVTIIDSEYEITQREIGINYGTTSYTYNGNNQYSSISPTLTNVLDLDKASFEFELANSGKTTTEFKNAGTYTLALKENTVTANYKITQKTQNYTINAYNLTLKVKNLEKNYNQALSSADFGIETITLAGTDKIQDVATINYEVYENETLITDLSALNVGTYIINIVLTEQELFNNYNISITNGTLTIIIRETYIEASDVEKYYDGTAVKFNAKLYGADNQEVTDATFVYTYYQNNTEVDEVKNVGTYTVKVYASAGDNNEPCEKTYDILIKTNIVIITLSSTEKEYDAKAFEVGYTYSMSDNHDISNILSYTIQNENKEEILSIKDAGKYYVNFEISNNNYTLSQEEFEVNITPINVNLAISAREETFGNSFDIQTTSYTTDVEPLTNESFELEFAVENYTGIVGTYTITAESKNSNYNVAITNGTLTISQRELVVEFTGESNLTYNVEGYANILTANVTNSVTENSYEVYYLNSNNQQTTSIINSGTYYLKVELLETHNYIFKDTTETVITKEITINKQELSLTIDLTSKTYDGKAIELNGVYANDVLVGDIYTIEYYNQETLIPAPTNVGNYSIKIVEKDSDNYTFTNNTKTFKIERREITDVSIEETFTYNKQARTITFTNFEGLVQGDLLEVTSYTIYDSKGVVSDGINVGSYTVQVNELSNANYYIDTLIKSFEVTPAKVTITLNPLSSIYGDALILDQLTYTTTDTIYSGDNLNVVAKNIAGTSVGTYPLSATYSNANYDVTIIDSEYEITQREISINYGETVYTYNGNNQYSSISPKLTNVLEADTSSFEFELTNNSEVTTEFKNAGTYTLTLKEHEATSNYKITQKSQNYTINAYNLTLKVKNIAKIYNESIQLGEFGYEEITLAGNDVIDHIVEIEYEVCLEDNKVDATSTLNVGTYDIKLKLTGKELFNNYNITVENGTLTISQRETYISGADFEKFYDGESVNFTAKLYGSDNQEITDGTITYTYYQNNTEVDEVVNVGTYTVKVKATAGENNLSAEEKEFNIVIKTNIVTITLNSNGKEYDAKDFAVSYTYEMSDKHDISSLLSYKLQNESKEELSNIKDAGKYFVKFNISNNNYTLSQDEFEVNITPINVNLAISTREETFGDSFDIQTTSYTTDVEPLTNESFELEFEVENYTGIVGEYTITAESKNSNYKVAITNGTLIISQKELVVEFTGESSLTYNPEGYANLLKANVTNFVTENAYEVYYLNSNNQQITEILNSGNYYLKVGILDTHNYKFQNNNESEIIKEIIINKKQLDLDIKINDKIYDGNIIELIGIYSENEIVSKELYNVEYYLENSSISAPKNVGKYIIKITEKISKNYEFVNNLKEFNIISRELTIKEIAKEFEYNRNVIKPELELNNVVSGEDVKLNLTYSPSESSFNEVGDYAITINGLLGVDSINYILNSVSEIKYSIIPTKVDAKVSNDKFTFTNVQLLKEDLGLEFVGSINVLESDYALSELPINAGEYKIILTSQNSGIEFTQTEFNLIIEKADIEGITFENKIVTYNNKPHSLTIDNLTLTNGVTLNVEYSENTFVNAGNYEILATLTNDNYNTKTLTATLTILGTKVDIQTSTENVYTYNGYSQGLEIIGFDSLWYKDLITYSYIGESYNATEKPINAGEYKLSVKAIDDKNVIIKNSEFDFVINKKAITLQDITPQTFTYSASHKEYTAKFIGNILNDEVGLTVLYNATSELPYNAQTYVVSFGALMGEDSNNYYLQDSEITTTLTILPYSVKVVADNKTIVYGEKEQSLTYTADPLLADDSYSGELVRESGNGANSYRISQGTLTAGENYSIDFVKATYNITQRPLSTEEFETEFVYNSQEQIPNVVFTNVVNGDNNVASVKVSGNTINAGTYTLRFILNNTNYKLPSKSVYEIVIQKQDISEVILSLVTTEKDYDKQAHTPIVLIDGDYSYNVTYSLNGIEVDEIKNAGEYGIKVSLDEQNYKGEKTFKFVVNKINYSSDVIKNAQVIISSSSFVVENISNISVGINDENLVEGNTISGLNENTNYNIYVKMAESQNYKATIFNLGEFRTSKSATRINKEIEDIIEDEIQGDDVSKIKELLKDSQNLSEVEENLLNNVNISVLRNKLNEYIDTLNEEIIQTKSLSDLVDFSAVSTIISTFGITVVGAGIMLIRRKKEDDK